MVASFWEINIAYIPKSKKIKLRLISLLNIDAKILTN
jgi:hypothetical protein